MIVGESVPSPLPHILLPTASLMILRTSTSFQGYSPGLGLSPGGSCPVTSPTHPTLSATHNIT